MRKFRIKVTFLTILLALMALPSHALVYYFNNANTIGAWDGDTTMPGFGSVEITRTAENWVKFRIAANTDYFTTDPAESSGLTWDKFFFNFNPERVLDTSTIVVESPGDWGMVFDRNVSSFGIFNYGTTGTSLPGALNPLEFTIRDSVLALLDFVYPNAYGNYFAGHLRRFGDMNEDSIYLSVAPVPEPGTLILVGCGLGGLLLRQWRRRSS